MFSSLLVANRGEIACRIIRTCRRLGIRSVAVYSDADRNARHVTQADEAVYIGASDSSASYLNAQALIAATKKSGAQAIHPGYGFLSEKTVLAQLCSEAGLEWVGPRADVIRLMGSKIDSKIIAQRAGVPTVPGYHGSEENASVLLAHAREIGWPLLIKASAGGGGKGMRRVDQEEDFLTLLEEAKKEAHRSFGDDRVLLEKLISRPRHLEVQLMGDRHGSLIHLHERECSIQRNYQKVIEEAPAAYLTPAVQQTLHERALRLGREIGYDSAGTVEFVLDEGSSEPYFLEMNTRLQVEHPVTEMITGLDLVELQIRIACGERLPVNQSEVVVNGHAIEARINCEDAANDYRPQVGTITQVLEPALEGVRIDCGVHAGSLVTPHYDSMLAKVIGFGPHRESAMRRLQEGLEKFRLVGVGTNQAFLRDVIRQPSFLDRPLTTHFLKDAFPEGWAMPEAWSQDLVAAGIFAKLFHAQHQAQMDGNPWGASDGLRLVGRTSQAPTVWVIEGWPSSPIEVSLGRQGKRWRLKFADSAAMDLELQGVLSDKTTQAVDITVKRLDLAGICTSARTFQVELNEAASTPEMTISGEGHRIALAVISKLEFLAASASSASHSQGEVRANMPGLVTEVRVAIGQKVTAGTVLAVLDSMKLLYSYDAPIDGEVIEVACKVGDTVSGGQLMMEIQPEQSS